MSFEGVKYVPVLFLRPSEMVALEHLSSEKKSHILPFIPLKRWATAKSWSAVEARLSKSMSNNRIVVGIDEQVFADGYLGVNDVDERLRQLIDPTDDYKAWHDYLSEHENFVPSPIIKRGEDCSRQLSRLYSIRNEIVVRVKIRMSDPTAWPDPSVFKDLHDLPNVLFIFDLGQVSSNVLGQASIVEPYLSRFAQVNGEFKFALCSSSFPSSFEGILEQEMFEFSIRKSIQDGLNIPIILSDYGGARSNEVEMGGGGNVIPPRIDIPLGEKWFFFRERVGEAETDESHLSEQEKQDAKARRRREAYKQAALRAIQKIPKIDSWGSKIVEKTAVAATGVVIGSQGMASRVRINMHIHEMIQQQTSSQVPIGTIPFSDDI